MMQVLATATLQSLPNTHPYGIAVANVDVLLKIIFKLADKNAAMEQNGSGFRFQPGSIVSLLIQA